MKRSSPMRRTRLRPKRVTPRRREAPRWSAEDWEAANPILLARCASRCEMCGNPLNGRVERAHRTRRRDGGDRLSNVLMLHPHCHASTHAHPAWSERRGYILPTHADLLSTPVYQWGARWVLLDDEGNATPCDPPS